MNDRPVLEFVILCGFLGSGKTTLLGQFLSGRDLRDTAVIVNEAGEVGIDAAVIQAQAPEDPVLMLDNGCVCCSLRSSLVDTVLRLLAMPRPPGAPKLERIVLETSGISRPGEVLATLRDRELVGMRIDFRVLATFDATRSISAPELQMDEALAQWAAAQRIVVTKLDQVDADGLAAARIGAMTVNPLAESVVEMEIERRVARAFARGEAASAEAPAAQRLRRLPHPRLRVLQGQPDGSLTWPAFAAWVDDLAGLLGERLLRFKAIVQLDGEAEPILLQSVGTVFGAVERAPRLHDHRAPRSSSIIVIVRDCEADWIDAQLPDSPVRLAPRRVPTQAFHSSNPEISP